MSPQSNPNWRHLEEYEQIKRKNRRRLVGAVLLTAVVALLLIKVIGSDKNTEEPGAITVSGTGETAASVAVETPAVRTVADASAVPTSEIAAAVPVSEPVAAVVEPPAQPPVIPDKPVETQVVVLPNPLGSQGNTGNPTVQPSRQTADRPESGPAPAPERSPATNATTDSRPAREQRQASADSSKPADQSAPPDTERRTTADRPRPTASQRSQPAAERPASRANRAADNKPQQRQLTPEEILNNRAAHQVAPNRSTEGKETPPEKRMVIQVGAYTSEEQARSVQRRLAAAGVSAYVAAPSSRGGNVLFRVRTGSYPNRQAANQALGKIKAQGFDGILLER